MVNLRDTAGNAEGQKRNYEWVSPFISGLFVVGLFLILWTAFKFFPEAFVCLLCFLLLCLVGCCVCVCMCACVCACVCNKSIYNYPNTGQCWRPFFFTWQKQNHLHTYYCPWVLKSKSKHRNLHSPVPNDLDRRSRCLTLASRSRCLTLATKCTVQWCLPHYDRNWFVNVWMQANNTDQLNIIWDKSSPLSNNCAI